MTRAIYIVILSRGKWWVDFEGKAFGPFTGKDMARQEAISLARFLTHSGRQSEVRVPDDEGHFIVEWESEPDTRWQRPVRRAPGVATQTNGA